jgi:hypothetical protein
MLMGLQDRSPQKRKGCSHCFRTSVTMCMRNSIALRCHHTASSLCVNVQRNARVFTEVGILLGTALLTLCEVLTFARYCACAKMCYDISGHYCMTITNQIKDHRHIERLFDSVVCVTCTRGTVYYSCPRPCLFHYGAIGLFVLAMLADRTYALAEFCRQCQLSEGVREHGNWNRKVTSRDIRESCLVP